MLGALRLSWVVRLRLVTIDVASQLCCHSPRKTCRLEGRTRKGVDGAVGWATKWTTLLQIRGRIRTEYTSGASDSSEKSVLSCQRSCIHYLINLLFPQKRPFPRSSLPQIATRSTTRRRLRKGSPLHVRYLSGHTVCNYSVQWTSTALT